MFAICPDTIVLSSWSYLCLSRRHSAVHLRGIAASRNVNTKEEKKSLTTANDDKNYGSAEDLQVAAEA